MNHEIWYTVIVGNIRVETKSHKMLTKCRETFRLRLHLPISIWRFGPFFKICNFCRLSLKTLQLYNGIQCSIIFETLYVCFARKS
jgi:hypothetical protein